MKFRSLIIAITSLALGGFVRAQPAPSETSPSLATSLVEFAAPAAVWHKWTAEDEDNICGISDLRKVTRPAAVDYEELLESTPQMKEIDREGIDPDSAEGKALRKGARTLITKACELVRETNGHCSIWKAISHEDGRSISDVTEDVLDRF